MGKSSMVMMMMMISQQRWELLLQHPTRNVVILSIVVRSVTLVLLFLAQLVVPILKNEVQPRFSTAAGSWLTPFVRWDTLHFVSIALEGYASDDRLLAFMPGLPLLSSSFASLVAEAVAIEHVVLAGIVSCFIAGVLANVVLYKLTHLITHSRAISFTVSLLFLLPPSPPTLNAVPYTEPFSALFTFLGMYAFGRKRYLLAAIAWGMASSFRSQSIVLGPGFFGWHFLLGAWRGKKTNAKMIVGRLAIGIPCFMILSFIASAPFFLFQLWAHQEFCVDLALDQLRKPWCDQGIGLSYGWIQREYWNNGFLNYWTFLQIPNFVLASPVLALSFHASYDYYSTNLRATFLSTFPFLPLSFFSSLPPAPKRSKSKSFFYSEAMLPFIHLHTAITLLLFTASHVQIILRVCATNPVLFWYVAELLQVHGSFFPFLAKEKEEEEEEEEEEDGVDEKDNQNERRRMVKRREWGMRWIKYCFVWGSISISLWAGYYPPA